MMTVFVLWPEKYGQVESEASSPMAARRLVVQRWNEGECNGRERTNKQINNKQTE